MPLPPHVAAFVERWVGKRERYGTDKLDDCFDRFFTSFVIYNFLYGWITQSKGYNLTRDREQATKVPKRYLGAVMLRGNKGLRNAAATIAGQIGGGQFTLKSLEDDQMILQKLNSNDPEQWCLGIM